MIEKKLELYKALAAVHKAINEDKLKTNSNVSFGKTSYKYIGLPGLLEYVRPKFEDNGLILEQDTTVNEAGIELLRLTIIHTETGQLTSSNSILSQDWDDVKGWGGENTYKRRYMLFGKLGIFPEDDKSEEKTYSKSEQSSGSIYINEKQIGLLKARLREKPDKEPRIINQFQSFDKIPWREFKKVLEWVASD